MSKYKELDYNKSPFGENYFIYSVINNGDRLLIKIKSRPHDCNCPYCGG